MIPEVGFLTFVATVFKLWLLPVIRATVVMSLLNMPLGFVSRHRHARVIEAAEGQGMPLLLLRLGIQRSLFLGSWVVTGKSIEQDVTLDEDESRKEQMWRLHFSKALFLYEPFSTINKTAMMPRGCALDISSRLGLVPGQESESLVERDDDVPIDHIVYCETCCCVQIPRCGLVFLISRHHQEITTGTKFPEATDSLIAETSLGCFTCYTREKRNFVHFDASICSSNVPLIPNQNLDDILLGAQGYYLINDTVQNKEFRWRRCSDDSLEFLASGNFFGIPNAVIYMPKAILKKWKRLEEFSRALQNAMNATFENLHEPTSFAMALRNLPEADESNIKNSIPMSTTAERLATCVYLCRALSRKNLIEMDFDGKLSVVHLTGNILTSRMLDFHMFARMNIEDLTEAHQHFRSPAAESGKLFQTSQDRFMRLLRKYRPAEDAGGSLLRDGLLGLLYSNHNNVSLVVFQGFLATVARWNCCRVLSRAREVPKEWINFVVADDDIYWFHQTSVPVC